MALFGFWEGVLVKTHSGGGAQFGGDVVGIQHYFVVAYFDDFFVVRKFGAVLIGTQMAFEGTSGGQDRNTRQLPAMDMAKTLDAVQIVAVACSPVGINRVVGAQVDHAEGATGGVEKKPARVGCVN